MKYTRRYNKRKLQPNKRKTIKYNYYNRKNRVTKTKDNKNARKVGGKYSLESSVNIEPSGFFKLIKKYDSTTDVESIKEKLLNDNLYLYNILFKNHETINPSYYGNKTEELFANILSGAYDNVNRYDSKKYSITTDYQGKITI